MEVNGFPTSNRKFVGVVHSWIIVIPAFGNEWGEIFGRGSKTASGLQSLSRIGCVGRSYNQRHQPGRGDKERASAGKEEWGNHTELSRSFRSPEVRKWRGQTYKPFHILSVRSHCSLLLQHNTDLLTEKCLQQTPAVTTRMMSKLWQPPKGSVLL